MTASSTMPRLVMYSGVTKEASGKHLIGMVDVTFALYKEQEGGNPLWLETQNVHSDSQGRFSVYLGATKPDGLPQDLFVSGEARWLGVRPEGQEEQPRTLLLSVPYALKAGDAETIGGLPPSAFVLVAPAATGNIATGSSSSSASSAPTVPPLAGSGSVNFVPLWTPDGNTLGNSVLFQAGSGSTGKIGINTTTPATALDVKGTTTLRGALSLPATGTATATGGKSSQQMVQTASAFNSGTNAAVAQTFRWQAEAAGNNTSTPSGTLNLLFSSGSNAPTETGLHIARNGQITFAAGQTFPGTGNGTITGVTAGTDLTGGGTSGSITLNLDTTKVPQLNSTNTFTANQTVNGTITATSFSGNGSGLTSLQGGSVQGNVGTANNALNLGGLPPSSYQLAGSYATLGANTFTGNQSVVGNMSSNAQVSGATVNAITGYYIGGNPFDYGSLNTANEFFGFAGNQTMTGGDNVAAGQASFVTNTTGNYNTADGIASLKLNTTGSSNSALGFAALNANTTGGSNTAVGANAMLTNTTGSNNTALGVNAGPDSGHPALTNATAIGANAQVTASNALVLGSINGLNGAVADTLVGIGTTAPTAKLDVRGNANFTGTITFAAGQTFPGAGTITGVTAGNGLTGGGTSGVVPLSLDTSKVPQLNTANTFTGNQTVNANLSATGIVSAASYQIGSNLFASGNATTNNVYLGFAGNQTTSGYGNTGVGGQALVANAGGVNNTAAGQAALPGNTSGTDNVAMGVDALQHNTQGNNNTGIGVIALANNTTGANNTGVGYGAGPDLSHPNLTNATAIGANAVVSESNALVLGPTGVNVGIGTATPAYPLHVNGVVRSELGLSLGGNAPVVVDAPGIVGGRLTILANGNVGINKPNPSTNLDVAGNIDASGTLIGGSLNVAGGGVINGGLQTSAGITTGAGVTVGGSLSTAGNTSIGGSLTIKNDLAMNAAPRMYFGGFFPGNIVAPQIGGFIIPSKNILITRMTVAGGENGIFLGGGCNPTGTIGIFNFTNPTNLVPIYLLNLVNNSDTSFTSDSGPISASVAAGTPLKLMVWVTPGCGLNPGPNNLHASVEYVMQ